MTAIIDRYNANRPAPSDVPLKREKATGGDAWSTVEETANGGSLPAWFDVATNGPVTISVPDNTLDHLFRIVSPVDYEANAPTLGYVFEVFDATLENVLWSMDINGNFVLTQPTEEATHNAGFQIRNETGPIGATFGIDTKGGILRLSDVAGLNASKLDGNRALFNVPLVVGSLATVDYQGLPGPSVALTFNDDDTNPALVLTAQTADGTEATATIPLTPA